MFPSGSTGSYKITSLHYYTGMIIISLCFESLNEFYARRVVVQTIPNDRALVFYIYKLVIFCLIVTVTISNKIVLFNNFIINLM